MVGTSVARVGKKVKTDKVVTKKLHVDNFVGADEWESDEEAEPNRIGNVPLWYYENSDHIGYDVEGERIEQKLNVKMSEIDRLLVEADNPDAWRTIIDVKNQKQVVLTPADLEIIRRLKAGKLGVSGKSADEQEWVEFEWTDSKQPLVHKDLKKANFLPSKHEEKKILHLLKLIRTGRLYKPSVGKKSVFDIWGDSLFSSDIIKKGLPNLPAPKPLPPGHAESYNPPEEFLMNEDEKKEWMEAHPDDRALNFLPKQHKSLRHVAGYESLLKERFERCLDLYLCPRTVRKNWVQTSDELLPELPSLDTFKPFPEAQSIVLRQEGSGVTSVAYSPMGSLLAAGFRDGSLAIHSTSTAPYQLPVNYFRTSSSGIFYSIHGLQWHPTLPVLVFARARYLYVCLVRLPHLEFDETRDFIQANWEVQQEDVTDTSPYFKQYLNALNLMRFNEDEVPLATETNRPTSIGGKNSWRSFKSSAFFDGFERENLDSDGTVSTDVSEDEDTAHEVLVTKDWAETHKFIQLLSQSKTIVSGFVVALGGPVTSCDFHKKGVYIVTASPTCGTPSHQCLLHSLKKKASLAPLKRSTRSDTLTAAKFHPTEPWLCIAFGKSTKVYSLQAKADVLTKAKDDMGALQKKFRGIDQAVGLEMHPNGEHLMRASVDGKFQWFDFEYGQTPYKVMELSSGALTSMAHHPVKPLVAVGCSEGHVQIVHVTTENTVMGEALITPLNKLSDKRAHVTCMSWHPAHHWLATGHANGRIVVWI